MVLEIDNTGIKDFSYTAQRKSTSDEQRTYLSGLAYDGCDEQHTSQNECD